MTSPAAQGGSPARLAMRELVALTAAVMALNAFAIDMMLPALGIIGEALGAATENDRQLVIIAYIVANGLSQPFFGPLADRFGRKRVIIVALAGYIVGSALSVIAGSFALLIAARAFQGVTTAAARVAVIAAVRDQCSGRRMAEVMSLAITVFMAAPIIAPAVGQGVLLVAPWRGIFLALLLYGALMAVWVTLRLPETLPLSARQPLAPGPILARYGEFFRTRQSIGYTVASALCFAGLFGYIAASEQIFLETFLVGDAFAGYFAAIAAALGAATLINARLVSRFGMRRLTHFALIAFCVTNAAHWSVSAVGGDSLPVFLMFMMGSFFFIGLIGPNATALAMEPMGHIAGSASALNGFLGTTIAGFLGGAVGRAYDGTTAPIALGFLILGLGGLAVAIWTEKGRLFRAGERAPAPLR